jgi:glutamate/tyrosine decarboxylase-like PLP-dependent enzyme
LGRASGQEASGIHGWSEETERVFHDVLAFARDRLRPEGAPLDRLPPEALAETAGETITEDGLGAAEAFRVFRDVLSRACIPTGDPRYLAYIPNAPTEEAALFDLAVTASGIYGGTWREGAGAVHAENQALRWLADLAGFPGEAGGCFVQGGTLGNLSALLAARQAWLERGGGTRPHRWRIAASAEAHSSIRTTAGVLDAQVVTVPTDGAGRMTGEALAATLARDGQEGVFAAVATAGTTNLGVVDDLEGIAAVCRERGLWLHVDGAYGAAALAVPSARPLFRGIERADSFIVDPHKWLFAPFDCCALLYRDASVARRAHAQRAAYLEPGQRQHEWNPSDYAVHLTRRPRGLPFWFSLAVHGTRAYRDAVETTLEVARAAAHEIRSRSELELVQEPTLSIVAFRRRGWSAHDYDAWSERLLDESGTFVLRSTHRGEPIVRLAIVHPRTSLDDIRAVLDSLRAPTTLAAQG